LSADDYEDALESNAGEQLRALLTRQTGREREIIDARFGFGRASERLVEIGDRLDIDAERVRQLGQRAPAKLRQAAASSPARTEDDLTQLAALFSRFFRAVWWPARRAKRP
jgi:DNA-directed RNA polymerase sigma subunit (sigma70/sigma32)